MNVGEMLAMHVEDQHKINESVLNALQVFKDTDKTVHDQMIIAIERLTSIATSFETEINLLRDRINTLEADAHSHDESP